MRQRRKPIQTHKADILCRDLHALEPATLHDEQQAFLERAGIFSAGEFIGYMLMLFGFGGMVSALITNCLILNVIFLGITLSGRVLLMVYRIDSKIRPPQADERTRNDQR